MTDVTLTDIGITLDHHGRSLRFHAMWLRDNAWDDGTRSPGNGQRLIALRDIPRETTISAAHIEGDTVQIHFMPEDKTIAYDINWLLDHAYDQDTSSPTGWLQPGHETWDSRLSDHIPTARFDDVSRDKSALRTWLSGVAKYGFGKLDGGPVHDQALMKVVDLFGYVRQTN